MTPDDEWTKEDELEVLAETRQKLAAVEREWKMLRETSRATTMRLITEHHVSIAKAAQLSGHHRNTIMVWLKVHNALRKDPREIKRER